MRLGRVTLAKNKDCRPLCADQAGRPRTCLPPLTKLGDAAGQGAAVGPKNRLLKRFQESELLAAKR